ncbi:hypothetical protein H6F51_24775 [Cyanobacteria bacterium FACHB-DQ100]|nr:hypothetical protein [Cyanobacteria bacterium FACHB-DQ100]
MKRQVKSIVLPLRLSPVEWEALQDRAKLENSNGSAIARQAISEYLVASPTKRSPKAA